MARVLIISLLLISSVCGTVTRVGNSYMKNPNSCCSLDPNKPARNCAVTSLLATDKIQLAYSPGFPNRFPIGRQCTWTVQCQEEYQVRLEFRDFYLIGPDSSGYCVDQYVTIMSPLTGHKMGRFCGNSGIPTIVSAGNLVVVQLHAEIPQSSENYRGFILAFRETLESPNPEMRPANWINHGQFSLSEQALAVEIRKLNPTDATTSTEPPPTTTTKRMIILTQSNPPAVSSGNTPIRYNTFPRKPVVPSRNRPPNFANSKPGGPNIYGYDTNRRVTVNNNKKKAKSKSELAIKPEVIAGIVVGGVCGIALCILIGCKCHQVCNNKKKTITSDQSQSIIHEENICMKEIRTNEVESTHKSKHLPTSVPQTTDQFTHDSSHQSQQTSNNTSEPILNNQDIPAPPQYSPSPIMGLHQTYPHFPTMHPNPGFYGTLPDMLPSAQMNPQSHQMLLYDPTTGVYFNSNRVDAQHYPNVMTLPNNFNNNVTYNDHVTSTMPGPVTSKSSDRLRSQTKSGNSQSRQGRHTSSRKRKPPKGRRK